MKFSDAMAFYDYKYLNFSRGIKVTRLTIVTWKEKNHIPFKHQCMLQVISDGQLIADKDAWLRGEIE